MRAWLFSIAGILLVTTALVYGNRFWGDSNRLRPPEELAKTALNGATPQEQEKAALDLARHGPEALPHMRRVLDESASAPVRCGVIQALGVLGDTQSMPKLLALMADPSEAVRDRAGVAVAMILGEENQFRAKDPLPRRTEVIRTMTNRWRQMQALPPPALKKAGS